MKITCPLLCNGIIVMYFLKRVFLNSQMLINKEFDDVIIRARM